MPSGGTRIISEREKRGEDAADKIVEKDIFVWYEP